MSPDGGRRAVRSPGFERARFCHAGPVPLWGVAAWCAHHVQALQPQNGGCRHGCCLSRSPVILLVFRVMLRGRNLPAHFFCLIDADEAPLHPAEAVHRTGLSGLAPQKTGLGGAPGDRGGWQEARWFTAGPESVSVGSGKKRTSSV